MCVDSLLNRRYLLVSGSVRVRVRARARAIGLALGLQLGIGIGFRRNHSWSSIFTPRRNHSLCQLVLGSNPLTLSIRAVNCPKHSGKMYFSGKYPVKFGHLLHFS